MACNALLGKNATVSGVNISAGYLRDFSVAKMVELIDATGIGSTGPIRDRVVQFEDVAFSASGLTTGTAAASAGDYVTVSTDCIDVSGIVTASSSSGTWDGFVMVAIQGIGTACTS